MGFESEQQRRHFRLLSHQCACNQRVCRYAHDKNESFEGGSLAVVRGKMIWLFT